MRWTPRYRRGMRLAFVVALFTPAAVHADTCLGVGCPGIAVFPLGQAAPAQPWPSFLEVDVRSDIGSYSTDAMATTVRGGALAVGVRKVRLGIFGEMSVLGLADSAPGTQDLVARFGASARYTLLQSDPDPSERKRLRERTALWIEAGIGEEVITQSGFTRERGDLEAAIAVQVDAVRGKAMTSTAGLYLGFRTTVARGAAGLDPGFLFILGQAFGGALY